MVGASLEPVHRTLAQQLHEVVLAVAAAAVMGANLEPVQQHMPVCRQVCRGCLMQVEVQKALTVWELAGAGASSSCSRPSSPPTIQAYVPLYRSLAGQRRGCKQLACKKAQLPPTARRAVRFALLDVQ